MPIQTEFKQMCSIKSNGYSLDFVYDMDLHQITYKQSGILLQIRRILLIFRYFWPRF